MCRSLRCRIYLFCLFYLWRLLRYIITKWMGRCCQMRGKRGIRNKASLTSNDGARNKMAGVPAMSICGCFGNELACTYLASEEFWPRSWWLFGRHLGGAEKAELGVRDQRCFLRELQHGDKELTNWESCGFMGRTDRAAAVP